MCGISGIVGSFSERDRPVLERITQTLTHRGPNEQAYHVQPGLGLGFCRLAIIDLAGGHQPMFSENGRSVVVFNGEIYNFQTIRRELEGTGRHTFRTHSDTEVLLRAYEEYGDDCVQHFRGMFAFAIWDTNRKRLFVGRDRLGKKPFFYFTTSSGSIVFASELKSLLHHPECPREIDLSSIQSYLRLQYIPSPRSIYQGISKLPAAHTLTWSASDGVQIHRYWDLSYEPKVTYDYNDAKERLRCLLNESVRLRMIADVPLGAFLSGGIDSSVIVALMAKQSTQAVKTFTIGFEESEFSELPQARLVAERYHTDHSEFIVKPELITDLPRIAENYSEPFADPSALPSYYLAQMTRQHVTVALNGDGGDETFAGYLRHKAAAMLHYWNLVPRPLRRGVSQTSRSLLSVENSRGWQSRLRRFLDVGAQSEDAQYFHILEYLHPYELDRLWKTEHRAARHTHGDEAQLFQHANLPSDWLDRILYLDFHHYLPDCLMTKSDIATMSNSLEARSPLLDHVLVEETARWPHHWKLTGSFRSKHIFKDTFQDDIPAELLNRTKRGFGIPIARWFRTSLRDYLQETLLSQRARQRGLFEMTYVESLIQDHLTLRADRSSGLWALLMLELWFQRIEDRRAL